MNLKSATGYRSTEDLAEVLAMKASQSIGLPEGDPRIKAIQYQIERELDKLLDEGTLKWGDEL